MEKYKVLIIEDNPEHYIQIQQNLISNHAISRLPFDYNVTAEEAEKRRKYLRELHSCLDSKVTAEDCLSEKERSFINLLRQHGCLQDAKNHIDEIIKENFQDLRLIICDLKICEENVGGAEIIRHIRRDSRILEEGKSWYLANIPIIVLTGLDGYVTFNAQMVGGWNCRLYKKVDVLDIMETNTTEDSTEDYKKNISSCQSLFQSIVDMLVDEFDRKYQYYMNRKEFEIALSGTGINDLDQQEVIPHKEFLCAFAKCLYSYFTEDKVFFYVDKNRITNFQRDLEVIYGKESKYVIVIITDDYNTDRKSVTKEEWRIIKNKYEPMNWEGVFFVVIEKRVANIDIIKRNLGIKSDVPFINFSNLRDAFYQTINDKILLEACNNITDNTKSHTLLFQSLEKSLESMNSEIEKAIIDVIKRKGKKGDESKSGRMDNSYYLY